MPKGHSCIFSSPYVCTLKYPQIDETCLNNNNKTKYEVTEDIFDMSNVRIFNKEIEKKKWGMFIICYVFGQLSSVKSWLKEPMLFQTISGDASRVQDSWNLAKTRVRTKKYALRPNAA